MENRRYFSTEQFSPTTIRLWFTGIQIAALDKKILLFTYTGGTSIGNIENMTDSFSAYRVNPDLHFLQLKDLQAPVSAPFD